MNTPTPAQALADKTHEGFTITCDKCKCGIVIVGSDIGYSELSGQWGGVYLQCTNCLERTYVYGY